MLLSGWFPLVLLFPSLPVPLGIVPSIPITIGLTVTFMFHSFLSSLAMSICSSLFSLSFKYYSVVCRDNKVRYLAGSLFCWLSLSLVIWPTLGDRFVSQNSREVCGSHSAGQIPGCAYTTLASQWITFSTQSCLVLYSFCINLQHSLIIWLIISCLSTHNLHLLFLL